MPGESDRELLLTALLRRAASFRAMAAGFAYPEEGYAARVRAAFGVLPDSDGEWHTVRQAWDRAPDDELRAEYARLFLGTTPCPPHETAYGDGRRFAGRQTELADLGGFYAAFGLQLSDANPDLPDHLATELEFYSLLLVKAAYALAEGLEAEREITQAAGRSFLECHLGRWVGAFAARLGERGASEPYRELARFLEELVNDECRRLGVTPAPFTSLLPLDEVPENELTCPRGTQQG